LARDVSFPGTTDSARWHAVYASEQTAFGGGAAWPVAQLELRFECNRRCIVMVVLIVLFFCGRLQSRAVTAEPL